MRPWTAAQVLQQKLARRFSGSAGPARVRQFQKPRSRIPLPTALQLWDPYRFGGAGGGPPTPSGPMESANDADRTRVRALLAQQGQVKRWAASPPVTTSPTSSLRPGKQRSPSKVKRRHARRPETPIGDVEAWPGAIEAWLRQGKGRAWIPAVLAVSETGGEAYHRAGFDALEIGDEAVVEVSDTTSDGRAMRSVRQGVDSSPEGRLSNTEIEPCVGPSSGPADEGSAALAGAGAAAAAGRENSMALSRFAGAGRIPNCLIVKPGFSFSVRSGAAVHRPGVTMDCLLTWCAAIPIWRTG